MNFLIRVVAPDDVEPLRALRLEALQRDPDAFLATVAAELANSDLRAKTKVSSL